MSIIDKKILMSFNFYLKLTNIDFIKNSKDCVFNFTKEQLENEDNNLLNKINNNFYSRNDNNIYNNKNFKINNEENNKNKCLLNIRTNNNNNNININLNYIYKDNFNFGSINNDYKFNNHNNNMYENNNYMNINNKNFKDFNSKIIKLLYNSINKSNTSSDNKNNNYFFDYNINNEIKDFSYFTNFLEKFKSEILLKNDINNDDIQNIDEYLNFNLINIENILPQYNYNHPLFKMINKDKN